MNRRIGRLIQIGIFAAMPAGVALAQSAGSSTGSQPAPGTSDTQRTDDTRTPTQKKADQINEAPATPNEATRPGEMQEPSRDTNQGTPGTSETKGAPDSSGATKKGSEGGGEGDTGMEHKSTSTKHKHSKKSSESASPSEYDTGTPKPEQKSDMNPAPDDSLNHRLDSKDPEHKGQLNSDK
jgi:hypothetical protein